MDGNEILNERLRQYERRLDAQEEDRRRAWEAIGQIKERLAVSDTRIETLVTSARDTQTTVRAIHSRLDSLDDGIDAKLDSTMKDWRNSIRWWIVAGVGAVGVLANVMPQVLH